MPGIRFDFTGKNFAVVGASSGIGKQIARDLAESGAVVLAIARNAERLSNLRSEFPDKIRTSRLDAITARAEDWKDSLYKFTQECGKLSGGVYAAGISGMSPLRGYDEGLAQRIVDTSFWGMVRFLSVLSRKKTAERGSSFVVFASTAAYHGNKGQFAYSASKAAVQSAVRSFAKEICRDQHRINSISPGWVETDMSKKGGLEIGEDGLRDIFQSYPLGVGRPEDVSGAVLFLLSDAARWITGTDVVVDGGGLLGTN